MNAPIHAPAFYNEIEPYLCAWLNNQIAAGLIPPGRVDGRDIRDLDPHDLAGHRQVHLFAGVGGWAYAARLACLLPPRWRGRCAEGENRKASMWLDPPGHCQWRDFRLIVWDKLLAHWSRSCRIGAIALGKKSRLNVRLPTSRGYDKSWTSVLDVHSLMLLS